MDVMARDGVLVYRLFKQKLMHMLLPVHMASSSDKQGG
jgi:hypothetical protein